MLTLEVECDTLKQLGELLEADKALAETNPRMRGVDVILLDNMTRKDLAEGVRMIRSHPRLIISEASGGIRPDNLRDVATTGVDFVSMGALTHTVNPIDLGLDFID